VSYRQFTPAVSRRWLFAVSGWLWTAVGVMLCSLAAHWLLHIAGGLAVALGSGGAVLAVVAYRFMFLKIVRKNIARIEQRPDVTCFFAFQPWRSYGLMVFMIALGITLRHSALPKYYLAVVYTGIGGALFLASFSYHARFWQTRPR
jgi:hypothetical protein